MDISKPTVAVAAINPSFEQRVRELGLTKEAGARDAPYGGLPLGAHLRLCVVAGAASFSFAVATAFDGSLVGPTAPGAARQPPPPGAAAGPILSITRCSCRVCRRTE